jgi:hypothetical protein
MKELLAQPVEYRGLRLAPTTELAALAELADTTGHEERLRILVEVAAAVAAEDAARQEIAARRARPQPLPRRR